MGTRNAPEMAKILRFEMGADGAIGYLRVRHLCFALRRDAASSPVAHVPSAHVPSAHVSSGFGGERRHPGGNIRHPAEWA